MDTLTVSTTLTRFVCPECAGIYALAEQFMDEARRKGGFKQCWTCPYCKSSRGYGESEVDRKNTEIARLERAKIRAEECRIAAEKRAYDALKEADHFRKSRDGMKGAFVRERKRISNGVCPCCNRTFVNLMQHMQSQHPNHANTLTEKSSPPAKS